MRTSELAFHAGSDFAAEVSKTSDICEKFSLHKKPDTLVNHYLVFSGQLLPPLPLPKSTASTLA